MSDQLFTDLYLMKKFPSILSLLQLDCQIFELCGFSFLFLTEVIDLSKAAAPTSGSSDELKGRDVFNFHTLFTQFANKVL